MNQLITGLILEHILQQYERITKMTTTDKISLPEDFPPVIIVDNIFYIGRVCSDNTSFKIDVNYEYNGFNNLRDLVIYYNYIKTGKVVEVNGEKS